MQRPYRPSHKLTLPVQRIMFILVWQERPNVVGPVCAGSCPTSGVLNISLSPAIIQYSTVIYLIAGLTSFVFLVKSDPLCRGYLVNVSTVTEIRLWSKIGNFTIQGGGCFENLMFGVAVVVNFAHGVTIPWLPSIEFAEMFVLKRTRVWSEAYTQPARKLSSLVPKICPFDVFRSSLIIILVQISFVFKVSPCSR